MKIAMPPWKPFDDSSAQIKDAKPMDDLKLLFTQFGSEFVYYPNLNAILAWIFDFIWMRENIDPSKTRMVQGPNIYIDY